MPLRIDEMYAYVIEDGSGDECVPATMDTASGMLLPLVGADRERMRSLRPFAEEAAGIEGRSVRLLRYSTREEVELIEPPEAPERPQEAAEPEPAPTAAGATYQTFSEPLALPCIVADRVLVAGSISEDGQFGLTVAFMIHGNWSPPVMVKGKVADDLIALAEQAREAARRTEN